MMQIPMCLGQLGGAGRGTMAFNVSVSMGKQICASQ